MQIIINLCIEAFFAAQHKVSRRESSVFPHSRLTSKSLNRAIKTFNCIERAGAAPSNCSGGRVTNVWRQTLHKTRQIMSWVGVIGFAISSKIASHNFPHYKRKRNKSESPTWIVFSLSVSLRRMRGSSGIGEMFKVCLNSFASTSVTAVGCLLPQRRSIEGCSVEVQSCLPQWINVARPFSVSTFGDFSENPATNRMRSAFVSLQSTQPTALHADFSAG